MYNTNSVITSNVLYTMCISGVDLGIRRRNFYEVGGLGGRLEAPSGSKAKLGGGSGGRVETP